MKKSRAEYKRQLRARKRALLPPQTCQRCGKPMHKRLGAKFCSDSCRQPRRAPVDGLTPLGRPIRKAKRADKLVRNYFRRHPELPDTLSKLLHAIGLTPADAALLRKVYDPYYFLKRYAQAWPKPFPSGQASPAAISMWNNLSKVLGDSLNLANVVGGNERAAFERLRSATSQRDIASAAGLTAVSKKRKTG